MMQSAGHHLSLGLFKGRLFLHKRVVSLAEETGSPFPPEWQARCPATSLETSWEEQLLEQQDHLEKGMEEAKKMISGLQVSALLPSQPFYQLLLFLVGLGPEP